jgi:hypothetical protein
VAKPDDEGIYSNEAGMNVWCQSRTQSNACARARMALALGKLTTGTPKFRGSGGSLSACTIDKR